MTLGTQAESFSQGRQKFENLGCLSIVATRMHLLIQGGFLAVACFRRSVPFTLIIPSKLLTTVLGSL